MARVGIISGINNYMKIYSNYYIYAKHLIIVKSQNNENNTMKSSQ